MNYKIKKKRGIKMKINYKSIQGHHPLILSYHQQDNEVVQCLRYVHTEVFLNGEHIGDTQESGGDHYKYGNGYIAIKNNEVLKFGFKTRKSAVEYLISLI